MAKNTPIPDSPIAEFEEKAKPTAHPYGKPTRARREMLERRQRLIDAGLIEDVPLPPEALEALTENPENKDSVTGDQ